VTAETKEPAPESAQNGAAPPQEETVEERRARARARTEAKNQAVRDSLEPLAPGERPLAVTIASIAAGALAIANLIAYLFSDHGTGPEHNRELVRLALVCGVLAIASIGMWRAKYWAVLGFQTLLGLQIIVLTLSVTRASNVLVVLLFMGIIGLSAVMFWYLVRAMARIQMPVVPGSEKETDG
jgi:hypothetical protein